MEEREKPVIEYIKIVYYSSDSKEAEEMSEIGHVADIAYHCTKIKNSFVTEIRLRKEQVRLEDIAHELGHWLQFKCEEVLNMHFPTDEELSFVVEDAVRTYIRGILYPQLKK